MTNVEVELDVLISLIEVRPVIWDKTSEIYKDRNETKNAWREIFVELKSDFDELEDAEKNTFGKCFRLRHWNAHEELISTNHLFAT